MNKKQIETIKNIFNILKNVCVLFQSLSFLYAFSSVLFWFLQINNAPFIAPMEPFFNPVYEFIQSIYKQPESSIAKVDLTGIITSICFIIIGVLIRSVKDYIIDKEEAFDLMVIRQKRENDLRAQRQIQKEYLDEMRKYNKAVILVDIKVQVLANYLTDVNITKEDLSRIKSEVTSKFIKAINTDFIHKKEKFDQNSIYIIANLEQTPECIKLITSTLRDIAKEYSANEIAISKELSFNAISDKSNISSELVFLKKIVQLKYHNAVISTSLFRTCFELIAPYKLKFTELGKFQFFINGQSQNYELFSVKNLN